MANLKSYNPSPAVNSGSTKRARLIGGAVTAAATAVLVLTVILDFNGCSSSKKSASVNSSSQNQSIASPSPTPVVQTVASLENKVETAIDKKKSAIKRISTATYKNATYGVSFRYPKTYTMLTPDKDSKDSAWPDPVAMNFTEPGGETLTTLVLPGTRASSYFKVSVNKNLSAEQCGKFATTPEQSEAVANPPVDANDDSISPEKTNVLGVDYSKAESVTDQSEARYYHHFENSACYEFALGVEDAPKTTKPIDHLQVFDKLERIMTTVKIKSDATPAVAATEPVAQPTPASNPQQ
ncbi:MAG TPA: hypothetical protein VKH81_17335 [Candidatus Angelobacter sp.]|nr:hypothetical protein [Candidatus Angelobacter sp.]